MALFNGASFTSEQHHFVLPAHLAASITRHMRKDGIKFSYYPWDDVYVGRAPLRYDEALGFLRPFEEEWVWSAAPCVITSHIQVEDMFERVMWLRCPHLNPNYDPSDSAVGVAVPRFNKEARFAELRQRPTRRVWGTYPSEYDGSVPLTRREALTAQRIVHELITDFLLDGWCGDEALRDDCCCRSTSQMLEAMMHYGEREKKPECATFPNEGVRHLYIREALAAHAVDIARWLWGYKIDSLSTLSLHIEMDYACHPRLSSKKHPRGIVRTKEGFLRELTTESAVVELVRSNDAPLGFLVRDARPDLRANTSCATGRNLQEDYAKLHANMGGSYLSSVLRAYEDYICDLEAELPVKLLHRWVSNQDDEYVVLAEVPAKTPGLVVRVYMGPCYPQLVVTSDHTPSSTPYYPSMRCWANYSSEGEDRSEEGITYLPLSEGPDAGHFSSTTVLVTKEQLRALKREYPQLAALVERLQCQIVRYGLDDGLDECGFRDCKQNSSDDKSQSCSQFVIPEEKSAYAYVAVGQNPFGYGSIEEERPLADVRRWGVEELDLPTPVCAALMQADIQTISDLVSRPTQELFGTQGVPIDYEFYISFALEELGLHLGEGKGVNDNVNVDDLI